MIELLVTILLVIVVVYAVHLLLSELALPANVTKIAYLIIGVVVLLWLLSVFGLYHFPAK